jgi:hypothetical protein
MRDNFLYEMHLDENQQTHLTYSTLTTTLDWTHMDFVNISPGRAAVTNYWPRQICP